MPAWPRLTIVTPSFNQGAYLEQTIRSVLDQGYPNLEYFVVDGGSSDQSPEIIRRYAKRLAWWVSEPDRGQAEAINKGLRRATGDVVAWINSDDYYLPGAFKAAVETLLHQPRVGLVYGDVLAVDEAGQPLNRLSYGNWGLEGLLRFQIIGQPAVFMRRETLRRVGYLDVRYHYLLDHQLWIRMAAAAGAQYVPELWAAARFHAEAKNVAQAAAFGREALDIAAWMQWQDGLRAHVRKDRKRILAGAQRLNGRYLSEGGDYGGALRAYAVCARLHMPTALADWKRIAYTCAAGMGGARLRTWFDRQRSARTARRLPPNLD